MSDVIVTINIPGDPRANNDRFLKAVCEDAHVTTLRKAVSKMMAKPDEYLRTNKDVRRVGGKRRKLAPVIESEPIPGTATATEDREHDEPAELVAV